MKAPVHQKCCGLGCREKEQDFSGEICPSPSLYVSRFFIVEPSETIPGIVTVMN